MIEVEVVDNSLLCFLPPEFPEAPMPISEGADSVGGTGTSRSAAEYILSERIGGMYFGPENVLEWSF